MYITAPPFLSQSSVVQSPTYIEYAKRNGRCRDADHRAFYYLELIPSPADRIFRCDDAIYISNRQGRSKPSLA